MTVKQAVSRQSPRLIAACRSGPLSVPAFGLLAVGQFTSTIGDCCYAVALPWLVLSSHSSAASLGVVLACYGVPRVVLTVPAGSLADRCGPRGSKRLAGQRTMVRRRSWTARPQPDVRSVWTLLRQERFLRIALVVSVAANFALIGTFEVTLPALAHARYGAYGFSVVLTCIAAMSIIGALGVARVGDRFARAALVAGAFQVAAMAIAVAPFLGGLPGLAVGPSVFGLALGFDNAVWGTLIQRWAPPELLGRVWGVLMRAHVGSFPLSALIAGILARRLGPAAVFPAAGALLALSYLFGLSHREFRELGRQQPKALASVPKVPCSQWRHIAT